MQYEESNSEPDSEDTSEDGHTYGTDCLNIGEAANDSESESNRILVERKEDLMADKKYKDNSTKRE